MAAVAGKDLYRVNYVTEDIAALGAVTVWGKLEIVDARLAMERMDPETRKE
jgi:hypothetical protein